MVSFEPSCTGCAGLIRLVGSLRGKMHDSRVWRTPTGATLLHAAAQEGQLEAVDARHRHATHNDIRAEWICFDMHGYMCVYCTHSNLYMLVCVFVRRQKKIHIYIYTFT